MTTDELNVIKQRSENVYLSKTWAYGNLGPNQWVVFLNSDKEGKLTRHPAQRLARETDNAFMLDCYAKQQIAEFIAHARSDIPKLIAEIEHLRGNSND